MEAMKGAITTYLTAYQKLNLTRMKAPKTGVKDDPLTNILGSTVILGVHLVCLGTENRQKHQNPFFFGLELIYVGKSIPEKILEQLLISSSIISLITRILSSSSLSMFNIFISLAILSAMATPAPVLDLELQNSS